MRCAADRESLVISLCDTRAENSYANHTLVVLAENSRKLYK